MLNPSQQLAVDHLTGPLLILAGAGAGKTHTLTERIATLIEDRGVAPESILAVTFTNKAAKEMRERLGKKLGRDTTNMSPYRSIGFPLVGTFHSVGIFFLRSFIEHLGYDPKFVIYDEDDKLRLIKSLIRARDLDEKEIAPRAVIGAISQAKNQGLSAAKYDTIVNSYFGSMVRDIYLDYEKSLRENNAFDFDDILLRTHDLLQIPEVLERIQNKYEHIFVDEYQDTNDIQYKTIKLLASKHRNLSVVGDDWQGIYGWRGANIKNILSFQKDFPGAVVVKLEQNYRSTKTIISGANAVIKCNKEALDKTLWTDNEQGNKILLIEALSEKQEAELIVKEIKDFKGEGIRTSQKRSNLSEKGEPEGTVRDGTVNEEAEFGMQSTSFSEVPDYSKWAILYRTNSQSRLIEEALIRAGIQYKIYGGQRFYERKEVKDILAYMRLIFNPLDTMSLRRIINVPSRKIGEKSVETFLHYVHNFHAPFSEVIQGIDEMDELTPQARRGITGFGALYAELTQYLGEHSIKETMEHIIKQTQYIDYLRHEYGEGESESKEENLKEFANMASRYDGMNSGEALIMFLEDIALITDSDRDEPGQNNFVSMMTIHSSKGLEFENIIIAGAEEGLFPHSRTLMEPREIEEERRLMYVAMTRAKRTLTITRARERYTFGNYSANPASRFLKEIPEEFIERKEIEVKNFFGGFGSKAYPTFDIPSHGTPEKLVEKKRSVTSNDPSSFTLGERIRHVEFGIGTIVSIAGPIAEIAFSGGKGIAKMHLGIAPIEKTAEST
ncbi:MAG: UvrD-helicase domain-containing protein [Candidatus Gracilibacteria bacterium]|nr:UvrD-helicase domain-containing protein [Candidatus Gracilibacteria bacterium]